MSSDQSNWAYISWNEPKRTQKTLNIFKIILWDQNGPKWAGMSKPVNELKRA